MAAFGGISGDQLRQYIERIEKLEEEKSDIAENIRDAYSEAKGNGFDPKVMRSCIKLRKMDASDRDEQEEVLDLYKAALGMIPDFEAREPVVESVAALQNEVESPKEAAAAEEAVAEETAA